MVNTYRYFYRKTLNRDVNYESQTKENEILCQLVLFVVLGECLQ